MHDRSQFILFSRLKALSRVHTTANVLYVSVGGVVDLSKWLSRVCGRNVSRRVPWESCKLHVVALGVELTVLAEQQSDFICLSRASWACWFQADFHLCLVPLRVTAHSGYVKIVYYLFLASDVLTCILPLRLDMQQVSGWHVFGASAGGR